MLSGSRSQRTVLRARRRAIGTVRAALAQPLRRDRPLKLSPCACRLEQRRPAEQRDVKIKYVFCTMEKKCHKIKHPKKGARARGGGRSQHHHHARWIRKNRWIRKKCGACARRTTPQHTKSAVCAGAEYWRYHGARADSLLFLVRGSPCPCQNIILYIKINNYYAILINICINVIYMHDTSVDEGMQRATYDAIVADLDIRGFAQPDFDAILQRHPGCTQLYN